MSAEPTRRAVVLAHAAMALQTALIGPGYTFTRDAATHIPPFTLLWLRLSITALLFIGWFALNGKWKVLRTLDAANTRRLWLVTLLGITANQFFFMVGLRYTTPASSALLYGLSPAVVLLMAVVIFRTEKFRMAKLGGLVLSFLGVLLVFLSNGGEFAGDRLFGNFITLFGVGAFSFYMVYSRPLFQHMHSLTLTGLTMVLGAAVFIPVGIIVLPGTNWAAIPPEAWFGLGYLIAINSIVSYALILYALTTLKASQVTIYMNLQPVSATLFSVLYAGEELTTLFLLGGLLTVSGIFWMNRAN
jgi:drug/metabolite transporter (DMT)-like permease